MNIKETIKKCIQEILDEISTTGSGASMDPGVGETTASKYGYKKVKRKHSNKAIEYKELWEDDEECDLKENYSSFKKQSRTRNKTDQYHSAIKTVRKKMNEANKFLEYACKLKNELNECEDDIKISRHTQRAMEQISSIIKEMYIKSKQIK